VEEKKLFHFGNTDRHWLFQRLVDDGKEKIGFTLEMNPFPFV